MDPIPQENIDYLISIAQAKPIDSYINNYCSREDILKFKGTIPEWCLIETLIFLGLNFS